MGRRTLLASAEILLASKVYDVKIVLYSDQLNFEPQVYNSESEGETIYLVLRNAHFEPAYPRKRKISVNITLDDISTDPSTCRRVVIKAPAQN